MSKKKKFKSNFRAEILKQIEMDASADQATISQTPDIKSIPTKQLPTGNIGQSKYAEIDYSYVKKDLLSIAWIVGLILVILFSIVILSQKTDLINQFANLVIEFSHLNQ